MRPSSVPLLRCPACHADASLSLAPAEEDAREVREGELRCGRCDAVAPVRRGVAHLLHRAPDHVELEAAGLERFAQLMRDDGWDRERVLRLPEAGDDGYWFVQRASFGQLLRRVDLPAGARLLDVGSNTCWASSAFAERGLEVVALDIATAEMQGLHTADWWMDDRDVFFERVLGSMTAIPLADESVDVVFCCEVLHHNDEGELPRALAEAHRVLRPGGRLLVINETLRTLRDRVGNHAADTGADRFDGYEHAYYAWDYLGHAHDAGFDVEVLEPSYRPFFGDRGFVIPPGTSTKGAMKMTARYAAQRRAGARRALLAWTSTVTPRSSIGFVGTKATEGSRVGAVASATRRVLARSAARRG